MLIFCACWILALKEKIKTNTFNLDGFGKKLQDMEEHLQKKVINQMIILFSTPVCKFMYLYLTQSC